VSTTLAKICASEGAPQKFKELCPRGNNIIWLSINNSIFIVNVYLLTMTDVVLEYDIQRKSH
jgi:hypothetical protein